MNVYCHNCKRNAVCKNNTWGFYWVCEKCNAKVGCHPGGNKPLGTLAGIRLRELRVKAHKAFDLLWKDEAMTRAEAYKWMQFVLGLDKNQAHIAKLNENQCQELITEAEKESLKICKL